jgi:hypothetical protein
LKEIGIFHQKERERERESDNLTENPINQTKTFLKSTAAHGVDKIVKENHNNNNNN